MAIISKAWAPLSNGVCQFGQWSLASEVWSVKFGTKFKVLEFENFKDLRFFNEKSLLKSVSKVHSEPISLGRLSNPLHNAHPNRVVRKVLNLRIERIKIFDSKASTRKSGIFVWIGNSTFQVVSVGHEEFSLKMLQRQFIWPRTKLREIKFNRFDFPVFWTQKMVYSYPVPGILLTRTVTLTSHSYKSLAFSFSY